MEEDTRILRVTYYKGITREEEYQPFGIGD
jgi:hypothetical protein